MTARPDPRDLEDLEEKVDRLEEKVLGHRVDPTRDEDHEQGPAADDALGDGPGDEPTD